jgi:hypothetical protein
LIRSETGEIVHRVHCGSLGESVMFLSTQVVNTTWERTLRPQPFVAANGNSKLHLGRNLVPAFARRKWWSLANVTAKDEGFAVSSVRPSHFDYQCGTRDLRVEAGEYVFAGQVECASGGVALGLLDTRAQKWIETLSFDRFNNTRTCQVTLRAKTTLQIVVSACNHDAPTSVRATIQSCSLRKILSGTQESSWTRLLPGWLSPSKPRQQKQMAS